ncbi:MAG: carbon monoxide dehydrogenase subunit G [Gammaproteobacteria bacterium]
METSGTYLIHTTQDIVWAALNDPDVLQKCIPGCASLNQVNETSFEADVVAKIGPVKAKFKTSVALENIEAPEKYTLVGSSKAGAAGFGKGKADVTLTSVEQGTQLSFVADFKVGGKLAQIGSRLIDGATKKTADEFFTNLSNHLSSTETSEETSLSSDDAIPTLEATTAEDASKRSIWLYVAGILIAAALLWFGFSE